MKILMVCLGNICRSPLAEGIMIEKINQRGLDFIVDSAGTSDWHEGERPDMRSVEVARKHGIDISKQRSRPFAFKDFDDFDFIFAMDRENYSDIISLATDKMQIEKVHLILEYADMKIKDVPDPYFGADGSGFEYVFGLLNEACAIVIRKIMTEPKN